MPKISVVIPTLNEEKYLVKTLECFAHQSFKDFELIIADGGSTDKTKEISLKYGTTFLTVKNSNVVRARDAGLRAAQGEILVGADADTFYSPSHLETIAQEYERDKKIIALTGKARMVNGPVWGIFIWKVTYWFIEVFYRLFGVVLYGPAFNLSYKRQAFLDIGGYDTTLDFGGDELDVVSRLKKVGKVAFSSKLCPSTSGRRYKVGFFTFLFKHALLYYSLNYFLAKYLRKPLIKAKPVR